MKAAFTAIILLLAAHLALDLSHTRREGREPAKSAESTTPKPTAVQAIPLDPYRDGRDDREALKQILQELKPGPSVKLAFDTSHGQLLVMGTPEEIALVRSAAGMLGGLASTACYTVRVRRLALTPGDAAKPEIDPRLKDVEGALLTLAKEGHFSRILLADEVADLNIRREFVDAGHRWGDTGIYWLDDLRDRNKRLSVRVFYIPREHLKASMDLVAGGHAAELGKLPEAQRREWLECAVRDTIEPDRFEVFLREVGGTGVAYNPPTPEQPEATACVISLTRTAEEAK